ncbi:MAG: helix-turn-helix transcriptional regulator [Quinella sp. 3Q1]|nr:helix-turn-helix transcriptional regulator [Quinella sp. 3Q1]MBR3051684.1 helix-turn-helix transcriptional regulator [Selenomonadaceae bacterium]MBR6888876.1 helix-turn-helix transcriptional regulator [Selenomonadaceae bacterium]
MFKFGKSTDELFTELKTEKNLDGWRSLNQKEFVEPLNEYLEKLLAEKNLSKQEVIERSGLNREYAYHILSGKRKNPSRQKVLALAIAIGLNLEETQYLLRYARHGALYPRNDWDAVIISAIEQKLSVMQTNELLHNLGETLLLE